MNKKFSTLVASLLLAGGLFSANAQDKFTLTDAGKTSYYYALKINTGGTATWANGSLAAGTLDESGEVNESNVWKITPVKSNGNAYAWTFVNAEGVKLQFDKDGDSLFETIMNAIENEQIKKKGEEDEYECSIT